MLVCLDPGHGGYDPGATGPSGLKEKDVNLEVALKTGSYLERARVGVIFTRNSDQVPWPADKNKDLAARCEIANKAGTDLFVSVHCNGANDPKANGTETYSFSDTGPGADAAKLVQAELLEALKLRDRGTKTARFYVLRHTVMPAVLTELAFISNPHEEHLLALPGARTIMARAIARAAARHFGVELPEEEPRLVINGRPALGVPFKIVDGKTWVELRSFVEAIGGTVQWDERTKTVNVTTR
ncbi:MAG: N-acetylmuramoyl-L-alanine amidase [Bacillota bacterium]